MEIETKKILQELASCSLDHPNFATFDLLLAQAMAAVMTEGAAQGKSIPNSKLVGTVAVEYAAAVYGARMKLLKDAKSGTGVFLE